MSGQTETGRGGDVNITHGTGPGRKRSGEWYMQSALLLMDFQPQMNSMFLKTGSPKLTTRAGLRT